MRLFTRVNGKTENNYTRAYTYISKRCDVWSDRKIANAKFNGRVCQQYKKSYVSVCLLYSIPSPYLLHLLYGCTCITCYSTAIVLYPRFISTCTYQKDKS